MFTNYSVHPHWILPTLFSGFNFLSLVHSFFKISLRDSWLILFSCVWTWHHFILTLKRPLGVYTMLVWKFFTINTLKTSRNSRVDTIEYGRSLMLQILFHYNIFFNNYCCKDLFASTELCTELRLFTLPVNYLMYSFIVRTHVCFQV